VETPMNVSHFRMRLIWVLASEFLGFT
jgi:hypothetical protein